MCPPVIHSSCLPACRSKCPYGTCTINFSPVLSHENKPGNLAFPWIVSISKSLWNPTNTSPLLTFSRLTPVGDSINEPWTILSTKWLGQMSSPMASISATVREPFFMCDPHELIVAYIYGKSGGIIFFVSWTFQLNLQFGPQPNSSGVVGALGGFRFDFYYLQF